MIDLNKIERNLYLDDLRIPTMTYKETLNCQWWIAKSYQEFVEIVENRGLPEFISFDHDLGGEDDPEGKLMLEKTGYDCAKWLAEYCIARKLMVPDFKVHSMNPVGRVNIQSYLDRCKTTFEQMF